MILHVCDWLAPKFGISAKVLRIIFVIAFLFAGAGLGLYILLWLIKLITK